MLTDKKILPRIKYIVVRYLLLRKTLVAREKYLSNKFTFKTKDYVGRHIYKNGTYEQEITEYVLHHLALHDDDVMLDIGANIGWYSIMISKKYNCSIYAFEPDTLNFQLLIKNIENNKCKKVFAVKKAVANESTTKTLYRYKDSTNLGRHSLLPINEGIKEPVACVTIDQFLKEKKINPDKIKFIKIDIEGYEYFSLLEATSVLKQNILLLTEFSPVYMRKAGYEPALLIDLLEQYGFKPFVLENQKLAPITLTKAKIERLFYPQKNVFWHK